MNDLSEIKSIVKEFEDLTVSVRTLESTLRVSQSKMDEILAESRLLEKSTLAVQQAKPLLSKSTIKECENLANAAIRTVFLKSYNVTWDIENAKFVLDKGDYSVDLISEGGGMIAMVSFVFSVYLLIKQGRRRFLAFDEQFTQLSDEYLERFLEFIRVLCSDLNIDILLISHDSRIDPSQVDHLYIIDGGISHKEK